MLFVPISRGGMLEYNEGSITGIRYLSLVNTALGKLAVEGICLIAVVCDWFIIYSEGWDANVFSFVELRNNVRLLNVELRNYVISRQIVI